MILTGETPVLRPHDGDERLQMPGAHFFFASRDFGLFILADRQRVGEVVGLL
jgi:hypothetical protein